MAALIYSTGGISSFWPGAVRRLKGPHRPVSDQLSRAEVLAALSFIDAVIIFEEDTPFALIAQIKPDVLVKGGDYKISEIVGAEIVKENGGKVKIIPFIDGYSTTSIINRLQS
jgi:rfaE bifunctional protein nucleotidyltransferase chain/domain